MIVVSDTSPISNFFRTGHLSILHAVYGGIIIPIEVHDELKLLDEKGFNTSSMFSQAWIEIQPTFLTNMFYSPLKNVHLGEAAAISLAKELNAKYILIDDRKGQVAALQQNLLPIGTLGTLKLAKEMHVIQEVKPLLDKVITEANYWLSRKIYAEFLENCNEL